MEIAVEQQEDSDEEEQEEEEQGGVENVSPNLQQPLGSNYNKDGYLNQLFYDGFYYSFKVAKTLKSGDKVAYYRCRHYKGTAEIPGCKCSFRLLKTSLIFSGNEAHTCQNISNKKRKIEVTNVLDISEDMRKYVEAAAITEVAKPAKEIAMKTADHFKQKYNGNFRQRLVNFVSFTHFYVGIPAKSLTIAQMQALVYAARNRQFINSEGLICSYPANRCSPSDQRFFLQFFARLFLDKAEHKLIGWSFPELKKELQYENVNVFIDATFKCCPVGFKQCLVVMVYCVPHDMYIPAFFVLMTGKEENLYHHAFQNIISACNWKAFYKTVTSDFEVALLNSIRMQFSEARTVGCLFHFKQVRSLL